MNRGQLVTRVGEKLGMAYDIAGVEQTFLQDVCNEAVVQVLIDTHVYVKIGTADLTSGTAEYRLDSNILAIDDGKGSTPAGLGEYEVIPLDEMIRRQSAGYVTPSWRKAVCIESDLLIVSPTPSTSETLTFYYVPKPTAMSNDAHDPSSSTYGGIPTQYHQAIEYYMLWQGSEFDDKEHALGPKDYASIYTQLCGKIRKDKRKMRGRRQIEPEVGYPSRRRPMQGYSRNDIYPPYAL